MDTEGMLRDFVVAFADDWEIRKRVAVNVNNLNFGRALKQDEETVKKFYTILLEQGQYNPANGENIILFILRSELSDERDFWENAAELGLFKFDPYTISHLFSDGICLYVEF